MTDELKKPVRAYRLTLELEADSAGEMANALENLANRIEREEVTSGVWGGSSDGAIYDLKIDPNQTHEKFADELKAYLGAKMGKPK